MLRSQTDSVVPSANGAGPGARVRLRRWGARLWQQLRAAEAALAANENAARTPSSGPSPALHPDPEALEALVRERTLALETARLQAEEASRAKTLFLANMSHELRTPMHAVLSYAQLGRDATSPSEQREYFERIAERGRALLSVLSDILDLSRLEAGSMSMEFAPHDLESLVRDALLSAQSKFADKQVTWELRRSPECEHGRAVVDSVRMGQVFANILENAAHFSPVGGHVTVHLSRTMLPESSPAQPPRAALEIAISDQGIGIPEGELDLIFGKFMQSSKTRTNAGGTGLGLAICRAIVTLHRGTIWASHNQGPGATLRVVIPLLVGVSAQRGSS
jgi:signal transduction histidine kinase